MWDEFFLFFQKRPRDPISPRAPLDGIHVAPHVSDRTRPAAGLTCQPSALLLWNLEFDLFFFPSVPRKNSCFLRFLLLFTPATDRPTNQDRLRWRCYVSVFVFENNQFLVFHRVYFSFQSPFIIFSFISWLSVSVLCLIFLLRLL